MPRPLQIVPLIAAATLVACGGDSAPPVNPIQGVSPGGIWRGTESASGLAITGLVDETGAADFIRADGAQFRGQVFTSDNSISLTADAYAEGDKTFADGSTRGSWSMTGTIQERQTITATTTFVTAVGSSAQGTIALRFDQLYDRPSSLAAVAGEFAQVNGLPYSIYPDGSISQSALICEASGQISIIDSAYNLYHVQLTNSCDNGSGGHNVSNVSGLATLDNTVSPERLVLGLTGDFPAAEVWLRCDVGC
jgi:hypothetical protein